MDDSAAGSTQPGQVVGGGQAPELSLSLCSWFWLFLRGYKSLEFASVWV